MTLRKWKNSRRARLRFIADLTALGILLFGILVWDRTSSKEQIGEPTDIAERRVTFLAVGDIMLSRGVARAISRTNDPHLPFKQMESVFRSTDFNFGNLETPISGNDQILGKGLVFNMHSRDISGLREYNFKVLNLANNHALDQGARGLRKTLEMLRANGLTALGVGENLDEAWAPKTIVVNGVKIGFVGASYSSFNDGGAERNDFVARIEDLARLQLAIEKLRAERVDFIVATMHAGVEYKRHPEKSQIDFARAAVDYGADIVVGGHPHWTQTFEQYKGKYIFYSLGNFIFDQEWSRDTKEGLTLKITVKQQIAPFLRTSIEQIELLPVVIENFSTPRLADETESQRILEKIGATNRIIKPVL